MCLCFVFCVLCFMKVKYSIHPTNSSGIFCLIHFNISLFQLTLRRSCRARLYMWRFPLSSLPPASAIHAFLTHLSIIIIIMRSTLFFSTTNLISYTLYYSSSHYYHYATNFTNQSTLHPSFQWTTALFRYRRVVSLYINPVHFFNEKY